MFVLTFSPVGEKVNTNMALIHRQVKKSTLGKIVNNYHIFDTFQDLQIFLETFNNSKYFRHFPRIVNTFDTFKKLIIVLETSNNFKLFRHFPKFANILDTFQYLQIFFDVFKYL